MGTGFASEMDERQSAQGDSSSEGAGCDQGCGTEIRGQEESMRGWQG
jgi:hypothetical protein